MIKVSQKAKSEVIKLMEVDGFSYHDDFVRVGVKRAAVLDYLMI